MNTFVRSEAWSRVSSLASCFDIDADFVRLAHSMTVFANQPGDTNRRRYCLARPFDATDSGPYTGVVLRHRLLRVGRDDGWDGNDGIGVAGCPGGHSGAVAVA